MSDPGLPSTDISWRTATKSAGGNCVQVARCERMILVADSKNPGPFLSYTLQEWEAFLNDAKNGGSNDFLSS